MGITEQTRRESHEETNKTVVTVSKEIYEALFHYGPGSAWQIAEAMQREVYTVRPRLTEMRDQGKIKEVGTRWCERTKRVEAVWDVVDKQIKFA